MHHALTEQLESFGFTPSQIQSLLEIAKTARVTNTTHSYQSRRDA